MSAGTSLISSRIPRRRAVEGSDVPAPRCRGLFRGDDRGSSSIEFLFTALILLVPTVYLALALAAIQASDAAARSAAVGAARSWARNGDPVEAKRVAQESLQHRVDGPEVTAIDLACAPTACTWPQGVASATVTLSVSLPIVPALPGVPALTSVSATADYPVARFGRDGATR